MGLLSDNVIKLTIYTHGLEVVMRKPPHSPGPAVAAAAVLALLLAVAPAGASPTVPLATATGSPAAGSASLGSAASMSDPCPKIIQVDGRNAYLGGYICGTVDIGFGATAGPLTVGFTIGHCTGCDCSYVWDMAVGMQFTRTGVAECGWGSSGGGGDGPDAFDSGSGEGGGCVWGRDYIGWEPLGC